MWLFICRIFWFNCALSRSLFRLAALFITDAAKQKNEITKNVEEAVVDRGEERSENETRRNAESTSSCAHGVT